MNKFMVEASPLKRIASYFIDLILTIAIGFVLLATLGQSVLFKTLGASEASKNANDFAVSSGLVYYPDGKNIPELYSFDDNVGSGKKAYEEYLDKVWYYYTEFLNVAKNPNEKVKAKTSQGGQPYESKYYYADFFYKCLRFYDNSGGENRYFTYAKVGDNILREAKPVLNETYQAKVDANEEGVLAELSAYFIHGVDNELVGVYADAIRDMKSQPYYNEEATRYSYGVWVCEVITITPIALAFFLVIPLSNKGGRSLGKMLMGVEVVDIKGFEISTTQRIVRPILVTLIHLLPLIPNTYLGLTLYFLAAVSSFLMMSLGKKKLNIHERITSTIIVDKKASHIFKDQHEKSLYMEEHHLDEMGNPLMIVSEVEGEPAVNLLKEE